MRLLVLAAIGAIAGLASGLLGVGGGFLIVPLQIMWLGTKPHRAGGTSLAAILPIALVGASAYYFGKVPGQVDFVVAFYLVIGSTVGAYLGARYVHRMPERALRALVAALLVVVGIDEILRGLFPGLLVARNLAGPNELVAWQYALITTSGLVIGGLSGITGVGGGIFLVPTLVLGFGLSHHLAQGTSLLAIIPTAAVGAATHMRQKEVDVRNAVCIGLGGVPAVLVGAALALSMPQTALAVLFGLLLLFAASRVFPRRPGPDGSQLAQPPTQSEEPEPWAMKTGSRDLISMQGGDGAAARKNEHSGLRERVQEVYSRVATDPAGPQPFRVGRRLALNAGYRESALATLPDTSVASFAGVSCLPCFAELDTDSTVLDLGCGSGVDTLLIAPRVRSIVGIDFSEEMLAVARASARTLGLTNVEFRKGDAEHMPAEQGEFDVAVVNGIFNLNPARTDIFADLARVVRPHGTVFAAELILKGAPSPAATAGSADWFT